MGIDVSQAVALGFEISMAELRRVLGVHHPEVAHEEPRFDPKTGQPAEPKRVIKRHEYWIYQVDGQDYDEVWEASEALATKLRCEVVHNGCFVTGYHKFIYGVDTGLSCSDAGRCPEDSRTSFKTILERSLRLEQIGAALRELGFNPGEALLVNSWSVS